eukprot:TRINITY_DN35975_c0_g1_i1.p1 TRINITY_DN35975_c0_g1~~TRINITY_DN35975_c0_g1_i1.p1  ORF type:complete len:376 (+),score=76.48 TRINITY_DN35975_c0_g1_i1:182-1309(+)
MVRSPTLHSPLRPPPKSKFCIQAVDGCGLGVIAKCRISAGERILTEKPIFLVSAQEMQAAATSGQAAQELLIKGKLEQLRSEEQQAFWSLSDCHCGSGKKSAFGILQTNAIATGQNSAHTKNGLYFVGCRFNHSCKPNVNRCWIPELGSEVFHVTQDIEPGEELTIYYIDPTASISERQALLKRGFNFTCACASCSLQGDHRSASEQLRREYRECDAKLKEAIENSGDLETAMTSVWRMIEVIEEEFDGDPHLLQKTFYDGFIVTALAGHGTKEPKELSEDDESPGLEDWLEMTLKVKALAEGEHAETAKLRSWAKNPSLHPIVAQMADGRRAASRITNFGSPEDFLVCPPCTVDGSVDEGGECLLKSLDLLALD